MRNDDLATDLMMAKAEIQTLTRKVRELESDLCDAYKQIEWFKTALDRFQEIGLTPFEIIEMQARIEGLEK